MDISVVMPCDNCGPWVQEALQSIAAHTYQLRAIIFGGRNPVLCGMPTHLARTAP